MSFNQKGRRADRFVQAVNIPQELYQSLKGQYFIGYADQLTFGRGTSAWWARLYNSLNSGVILHVNVWKVTDVANSNFRAQFWFNADPPGTPLNSPLVTPSNTAIQPLPKPKVKLQFSTNVGNKSICSEGAAWKYVSRHREWKIHLSSRWILPRLSIKSGVTENSHIRKDYLWMVGR